MIIGVSGKIGSGKDTLGEIIQYLTTKNKELMSFYYWREMPNFVLEHQNKWEIKKFAGKLKQIGSILTGVPIEKFEDQEFKKLKMSEEWGDMTYRLFLQKLGTDAIRDNIHPNAWVNALFADYKAMADGRMGFWNKDGGIDIVKEFQVENRVFGKYPNWIITDVRFPNEANAVKERDGIMIRVNRGDQSLGGHASETSLDDYDEFDYVIDNNGTIEELILKVKQILLEIREIEG